MKHLTKIGQGALVGALVVTAGLVATPAHAGGGTVIGKVAGDVAERFNRAANPTPPVPVAQPRLEYTPPEPVPSGSTTWSTGNAGQIGPLESQATTFNRHAGDKPASGAVTDVFNHAGRGNN
ncbi:MAG: hypothetical protein AAGK02_00800 [Pseudomonadota bacterium]